MNRLRPLAWLLVYWMASAEAFAATEEIDFARDVLPILSDNCFQCHGPDAKEGRKGNLRLDDEEDATRDRGNYHVIARHDPGSSHLLKRIRSTDPDELMPPPELGRSLTEDQQAILSRWIDQGAPWGTHWAFQPVVRPSLPDTEQHPVDTLVESRLEKEPQGDDANPQPKLKFNAKAAPETRLRRLTLDLTGLPPTPSEMAAFLAEQERPGAWARAVDRVLSSTAFGERMAWDWLEAARYADSNGYQGDRDRSMWPWRDWVVRAFNDNVPFDTFTIWQLAGDLLPDASEEQLLATGFNRNHMINGEGGRIPEENRVDYVMDMTETMGTVWLGLTLNCCRCHDHKFDPLLQAEYFQLSAFFNQTPIDGGGGDPQTPPVLAVPSASQRAALKGLESAHATTLQGIHDQETRFEVQELPKPVQEVLKIKASDRKKEHWDTLAVHFKKAAPEYAGNARKAHGQGEEIRKMRGAIPKVMVMRDRSEQRPTYILDRGLYNQPRDEVEAAVPSALPPLPLRDSESANKSSPNRLDLARWLVSREHPLTARVTVNRFWQMLFGIGLVKTSEDFGVQAEYPVQRELLDWLAAEFMESGWDTKHLFRIILTSETYQRSSILSPEAAELDPENRFLARGPRFRMPSWMIRDQALAASGLLETSLGGPPVFPYQPEGVWAEATFGKKRYAPSKGAGLHRRSLYTFWRRIVGPSLFFDMAKRQVCEVKPLRTNTPMHALTTLNDVTYVEAARQLAASALDADLVNDRQRLVFIYDKLLGREPTQEEAKVCLRSLERARASFIKDPKAAESFRSLGQHPVDETLPAEEHAAWAALSLNLLNLDETLTKE